MDILVVQVLCLGGLFLSTLILTVLPLWIISKQRDSSNKTLFGRYENLISFANCLSGGVFLATFFVALLPEVRVETKEMLEKSQLSTSIPVTEVIILIGFFLATFVEQLAISAKNLHKSKSRKKKDLAMNHDHLNGPRSSDNKCEHTAVEVNDVKSYGEGGTTASTSLVGDANNEEEEEVNMLQEKQFVKENSNQLTTNENAGNNIEANCTNHVGNNEMSNGDHEHSHGGGHGHSHNVDILVLESTAGVRLGILLLSLGVHCLFEGMALGLQDEIHTLINLFIGIWIHECLIALALGFSMVRARPKPCRMWQIAVFFSSLIPLGQVIGILIGSSQSWTSRVVSTILQGIAAGTFVQVTFLDIIPEGLGPVGSPMRLSKVGVLFLGFVVITAVTLLVETLSDHGH